MTDCSVTVHDPADDTDDEIAEVTAFTNAIQAEVLPDEVPQTVEHAIGWSRATPARVRRWSLRARDEHGALVGVASTQIDREHDDNPDVLWVGVGVARDHRRRGLGRRLLAGLLDIAEAEQRTRLLGSTNELHAGADAFAIATGAAVKGREHQNHLLIGDVDRAQLERWIADAATRSSDYELLAWDGPVADADLHAWVDLVLVMNTAPRDDVEVNDFTLTPEQVRDWERRGAAVGMETWTLVARHSGDGTWAGYHDVGWQPGDPTIVWVDSTAVRPEHRGHALGKWLKAAMTLRIMDERPAVTEIRTGNADSNDAMLGINHAMGYRPWIGMSTWEVDVATARHFANGS